MKYPLYIRRDGATNFNASFPDFPRVFAQGNSIGEIKINAKRAVELMYDHSGQLISVPAYDVSELHALDMDDGEGIWVFLEVNLARATSQAIRIQVSLPDELLTQVDLTAREHKMTRSSLITQAVVGEVAARGGEQLSRVDPLKGRRGQIKAAQRQTYLALL